MPAPSCLSNPSVQTAIAIAVPVLGGWLSGIQTKKQIKSWYENLKLPNCRPPNWVFPPVWTTLYTGMGYASYVIWKQGNGFKGAAKWPLVLYGSQLALNFAWTPLFFGMHELKYSLFEILALTATAAATGISFYKMDKIAGIIFIPYVAWLSFASYLNYSIYRLNTPAIEDKKPEEKEK